MSDGESIPEKAIERLSRFDPTLKYIYGSEKQFTDAKFAELVDCLFAHPDIVKYVILCGNWLTDGTGVKLARYVAVSSTIKCLVLNRNQFGNATYLALAEALQTNTSLRRLYLFGNQTQNRSRIDTAFVEAMRVNPNRSTDSEWYLYSFPNDFFARIQPLAKQLGPPSMLSQLNACETWHKMNKFRTLFLELKKRKNV